MDNKHIIKNLLILMFLTAAGCYHYPPAKTVQPKNETVLLMHGVARTVCSMRSLAIHLSQSGYDVYVIRYCSTRNYIKDHARNLEEKILVLNISENNHPIHFVTHSLGGIVIRQFLVDHPHDPRIGRIVMIAPPNKGSEFADRIYNIPFIGLLCVPLHEVTTDNKNTVYKLGNPASNYEIGIIAGGKRNANGYRRYIPGDDDSTVSVSSTHLQGERDHIVIKDTHHGLLTNRYTAEQVTNFMKSGLFRKDYECRGNPCGCPEKQ